MSSAALAALHAAIEQGKDEQAEAAVAALSSADEPALLQWLLVDAPDPQWWAARALAQIGSPAAVDPLTALLHAEDATLRAVAAVALGALYTRYPADLASTLTTLAAKLADEDGTVRQSAADALARCGDDAVPVLDATLQSTHEGARTRAAYALRKIATQKAAIVLYHYLNDPNYMVHTYAHEALDELGLLENVLVMTG